jgi:regulatory protein
MRKHLRGKGFDGKRVDEAVSHLREKGLIDDLSFAKLWTEDRRLFNPRSRTLIRRELLQKGVDSQTAAEATAAIDEEGGAYTAAQKKAKSLSTADYDTFRNKLLGFLGRRGYDYDVSQRTVTQMWQERLKGREDAQ